LKALEYLFLLVIDRVVVNAPASFAEGDHNLVTFVDRPVFLFLDRNETVRQVEHIEEQVESKNKIKYTHREGQVAF